MISSRLRVAIAAAGLLLASCDTAPVPTQPSGQPPTDAPVPRSTGPIAFVSDRGGTDRIYLANEDGSLVTPLVTGGQPAWAKDGRQIAFTAGLNIHVIGVDGSGDRVIADGGIQPAWSPDGLSLVFTNYRAGDDSEIDVVNLDGSNRRSLFNSGGFISSEPTWSPDGQRILFSIGSYEDWCFGLWAVNTDGSGARQLRVPGPAYDPDWTPDGRLIYTKTKGGRFSPSSRIFISDGGTERQLIPEATAPARPSYSDSLAVWRR